MAEEMAQSSYPYKPHKAAYNGTHQKGCRTGESAEAYKPAILIHNMSDNR